jgi:RHS repeat-associated protein
LDYLTSASYTDGQPNASQSWSYDAAGNRNDATVVDNLNRATTIGGVSRTYDILGNTLTKSSASMQWDALNRMLSYQNSNPGPTWHYQYRADGMRVKKSMTAQDATLWTKYMYDGQMPVEETEYSSGQAGSSTIVRRNALGARGIDRIETVTSSGTAVAYPVYDGHGNMVATLAKSGSGYQIGNRRSFGAWGDVRQGQTTGDPKGRYVANLGHLDDHESGLTYMRARYYETSSGRFVSEDPSVLSLS